MPSSPLTTTNFIQALEKAGGVPVHCSDRNSVVQYIRQKAGGPLLLPDFPTAMRLGFAELLIGAGCTLLPDGREETGAAAGVTGANFAVAETGTVVLESTSESVRLATSLPERHFVLLDPRKILPDMGACVPLMREFHRKMPKAFIAWITGPSRTADIERVLTIGVHGPRELHVLLVEGMSDDPMEM